MFTVSIFCCLFCTKLAILLACYVIKDCNVTCLACLEIRSRNEETITNSTRNRIYSPKVFLVTTLSTSILFTCLWTDLVRVLATTGDTSPVASYMRVQMHENSGASIPEKVHHCQRAKKWLTWHVMSIIAENKSHAHHKTHLHAMKVYKTRPSQFC